MSAITYSESIANRRTDLPTNTVVAKPAKSLIANAFARSNRFSADSKTFVGAATALLATIYAASFYVSFAGQQIVATWAKLTGGAAAALPIAIDLSMVAFTMWAMNRASHNKDFAKQTRIVLASIVISGILNFLHVFIPALRSGITAEDIVGSVVSLIIPVISFFAAEGIIDMHSNKAKAKAAQQAKPEADPAATVTSPKPVTANTSAARTSTPPEATQLDPVMGLPRSSARKAGTRTPERLAAIRRAIEVHAEVGTVLGAAKALGVNRTVIDSALADAALLEGE